MSPYTGRGDEGRTDLRTGDRVAKDSPRIEAYGTVDEVNTLVGTIRVESSGDVDDQLREIQNDLHVVQAELANPDPAPEDPRIGAERAEALERWMDQYESELPPLNSFILPGGSDIGARLHHVRAVCRRAERRVVQLVTDNQGSELVQTYLNRLSDFFFVLARVMNARSDVPEESPTY